MHEVVKKELKKLNKNQTWLSKKSGIPASNISEFLSGKRSFNKEKLKKIADAFGKKWSLIDK